MQDPMNDMQPFEFNDSILMEVTRDFQSHEAELLGKQNVVGVGMGYKSTHGADTGQPCIKVLVSQKLPADMLSAEDMVPGQFAGSFTDVEEVGEIFAGDVAMPLAPQQKLTGGNGHSEFFAEAEPDLLDRPPWAAPAELDAGIQVLTNRVRPAKGGYSVGHYRVTAGTIATCVYDAGFFPGVPPKYYILSNNHVLANSNNARIGDPILQPGRYDGGTYPNDVIGRLSRWVPIRFGGPDNLVDAAIAEGPFQWLDRDVYWIGHVKGVRNNWPSLANGGEILQKTGRTTNYTTGRTVAINATVNVNYGGGRIGRFVRQIVTRDMSNPGDSGSLMLDLQGRAIGLLFAGSSTHTIANHIYFVRRLLGIKLD